MHEAINGKFINIKINSLIVLPPRKQLEINLGQELSFLLNKFLAQNSGNSRDTWGLCIATNLYTINLYRKENSSH